MATIPLPPGLDQVQKVLELKGTYNHHWLRAVTLYYHLLDGKEELDSEFLTEWTLVQTLKKQVEEAVLEMDKDDGLRLVVGKMTEDGESRLKAMDTVDDGAGSLDTCSGDVIEKESREVSSPVCSAQSEQ